MGRSTPEQQEEEDLSQHEGSQLASSEEKDQAPGSSSNSDPLTQGREHIQQAVDKVSQQRQLGVLYDGRPEF